jgi:hypothetical protein
MSYQCNGVWEFHLSDADYSYEELQRRIGRGDDVKVYGSWIDPTCYFYSIGNNKGGWYLKMGNTVEQALEKLRGNK